MSRWTFEFWFDASFIMSNIISPTDIASNSNIELQSSVTVYNIPFHIWEIILKLVTASDRQFDTLDRQIRQFKTVLRLRLVDKFFDETIKNADLGFFWSINKTEDIEVGIE